VDLSGGIESIGGLSVTFSQVLTGGQTTVVESGAGPPPPTGYRIVGLSGQPRYWDIDTTASYVPPITVCIHYDPAQVNGQEQNLRLVHDDGSGFVDITTSRDLDADVICGETSSLSPFAVVEPLSADSDLDGVLDDTDTCPATAPAAAVDVTGCSLSDLVPCGGIAGHPWKNHGAYVRTFTARAKDFVEQGLVDAATRDRLVSAAAQSACGR
jgi:hypothetical protein